MRLPRYLAAAIVAVTGGILTGPALAASAPGIGTLVSAATQVSAGNKGAEQPLPEGSQVYSDQRIVTDLSGIGQIEFLDHTKLAIGPGSTLTLDKFIYDPKTSKTDIVMGFGQGAFRFITGAGTHEGYQIDTPVATISVRGTAFDVAIDSDGEMAVAMIDGEVQVCSRRTLACRVHNAIGQFLDVTPDGAFTLRDTWDAAVLKGENFARAMPFMVNDTVLQPTFRASAAVVKQYASAAGQALNQAGQAVGQAANVAGQAVGQATNNAQQAVGQAATAAGQAAGKAVQAPAQVLKSIPNALKGLNPFGK